MNRLRFLLASIAIVILSIQLQAKDEPQDTTHHYQGTVTGLSCSACASKVKAALSKLDGVSSVKIKRTEELGIQSIQLESSSSVLTLEEAIKSLGTDAKYFTILTFNLNP